MDEVKEVVEVTLGDCDGEPLVAAADAPMDDEDAAAVFDEAPGLRPPINFE